MAPRVLWTPRSVFALVLAAVADDPERAFEHLRTLLFDVSQALFACRDAAQAQLALERFAQQRFHALLHHYQLSNWVLYFGSERVTRPLG